MPKMLTSLRLRLIASYIIIILICLVPVSLASIFLLGRFQVRLVFSGLVDAAVPTALRVSSLLQRNLTPVEIADLLKEQAEEQEIRILLLTPKGKVLADTQGDWTGKQAKIALDETPKGPRASYIRGKLTTPAATHSSILPYP